MWILVGCMGLATLGMVTLIIFNVIDLFHSNGQPKLETIAEPLATTLFFGLATFYLFQNSKRGSITIDPVTRLINNGNREISFAEVDTVISQTRPMPVIEGMVVVTFIMVLRANERVNIGSISGQPRKLNERTRQILTVLNGTIKNQTHDELRVNL